GAARAGGAGEGRLLGRRRRGAAAVEPAPVAAALHPPGRLPAAPRRAPGGTGRDRPPLSGRAVGGQPAARKQKAPRLAGAGGLLALSAAVADGGAQAAAQLVDRVQRGALGAHGGALTDV